MAVRYARDSVAKKLKQSGWANGFPSAWNFIAIDSNTHLKDDVLPLLPFNDYLSITHPFRSYHELNSVIEARFHQSNNPQAFADLQGWRPNPSQVAVPSNMFAGQLRAVGRTAGILALQGSVQKRIEYAFSKCAAGGTELAEVSRHLGVNVPPGIPVPDPVIIIVGSIAGGTGSGLMLDVADLVKGTDNKGQFPVLVGFTPDIFGVLDYSMIANSAAFMSELMSACWDDAPTQNALIPSKVGIPTRGPHSVFLIGRKKINGLDLQGSKNVFLEVGQTLGALTTSLPLQDLFFNHIVSQWSNLSASNAGGYGFQPTRFNGIASSFGSATISIGRDRFHDYLRKLLHRSIVEHLVYGYESIGKTIFGETIKTIKPQELKLKLANHFLNEFLDESGLQKSKNQLLDLYKSFATYNATSSELNATLDKELSIWSSHLFHNLLKTINKFVEKNGYLVVIEILLLCRESFRLQRIDFISEIESISGEYHHLDSHHLARERISVAFDAIDASLIEGFESSLTESLNRVYATTKEQDGNPAIICDWPKNDGVVPNSFAPSPVEFFLEDYLTWPVLANTLLRGSLGDAADLPINPVEAARTLIIRGGFGDSAAKKEFPPLIWSVTQSDMPQWEPSKAVSIVVADRIEEMTERIDSWLIRPSTELFNTFNEGLGGYLLPIHPKTNVAIPDHEKRLAKFRQLLTEVLMQSKPSIEIDHVLNATVHSKEISFLISVQGFPFGEGHPARKITESIIQSSLDSVENVDWVFSSGEAESVLITNFLKYPVHPSVINSFTQPLAQALGSVAPDLLRSNFWLWRRARNLKEFIPLPDVLRLAAIRGFAVSRILGTMTAEPKGQNQISTSAGIANFPKYLLTETDKNNILPVLLEAMILTFADVSAKGKSAFDAYRALIEYGTGGGIATGFEIVGDTARILTSGDYGTVQILDHERASKLASDPQGRVVNAIKYLDANIARFDAVETLPFNLRSWRNRVGTVEPVDTPTRELIHDLHKAYVQVREATLRFEKSLYEVNY
jgi:hypothetical protein